MTGREAVLGRIKLALTGAAPVADHVEMQPEPTRPRQQVVEQFAEYAADYRAKVVRCSEFELPSTIGRLLEERGSKRVIVPRDLPTEWLPKGLNFEVDADQDARTLDGLDGSITACVVAVAETGSLVLDGGPGQGRRVITLVPDHHICIVFEEQIVDSVPEAVAHLAASVREGRPLTWISGPSATSDIELTRVEGVHGARKLDIVIVNTPDRDSV